MSERRPLLWGGCAAVLLVLAVAYVWMNRGYGETSERGYQYATALFSACNQQDELRLQKIGAMVDRSLERGEIGQQEAAWLRSIIDDALAGRWVDASAEVRQLMEDQIDRRPAAAQPS